MSHLHLHINTVKTYMACLSLYDLIPHQLVKVLAQKIYGINVRVVLNS